MDDAVLYRSLVEAVEEMDRAQQIDSPYPGYAKAINHGAHSLGVLVQTNTDSCETYSVNGSIGFEQMPGQVSAIDVRLAPNIDRSIAGGGFEPISTHTRVPGADSATPHGNSNTRQPLTAGSKSSTFRMDLGAALNPNVRLPACVIGAVELLTFFPRHVSWPEAGLRLRRNRWIAREIAMAQLFARGCLVHETIEVRDKTIRRSLLQSGSIFFHNENFSIQRHRRQLTDADNLNAATYTPRPHLIGGLSDEKLIACVDGVVNWPVGQDRGIVTQCVEFAVHTNDDKLMISDIPRIALQQGFVLPPVAATGAGWDYTAKERLMEVIQASGGFRKISELERENWMAISPPPCQRGHTGQAGAWHAVAERC